MISSKRALRHRFSPAGLAGVVVGIVLIVGTSEIPPGSAAFPRVVGYAMIGLGLLELLRYGWLGPNLEEISELRQRENSDKASITPVLIFIVTTLIYIGIMPLVGFYTTTLVYLIVTMLLLGVRKIGLYLITPAITIVFLYFGFTQQLRVPLPQGILI